MFDLLEYHCPRCEKALENNGGSYICPRCALEFDEKRAEEFERECQYEENLLAWDEYVSAGLLDGVSYFACIECDTNYAVPAADGSPDAQSADVCCPLCGGALSGVKTAANKPDLLLPFEYDRQAAEKAFSRFCRFKPILPAKFDPHKNAKLLKKLYVPFWTADCTASEKARYAAEKQKKQRTDSQKQIKTDGFMALREGSAKYCGLLSPAVEAAKKVVFAEYSLKDAKPFYEMPDAIAALPDIPAKQAQNAFSAMIERSADKLLGGTVKGYSQKKKAASRLTISEAQTRLILAPVWIFSTEYKGKLYHFAMNAQSGKVSGKLPFSKLRLAAVFAVCTVAVTLVGALATLLL